MRKRWSGGLGWAYRPWASVGSFALGGSGPLASISPGSDLLSHAVASAVPSAQEGLTSVFGMGTGVTPPATPPGIGRFLATSQAEYGDSRAQLRSALVSAHERKVRGQAARPIST